VSSFCAVVSVRLTGVSTGAFLRRSLSGVISVSALLRVVFWCFDCGRKKGLGAPMIVPGKEQVAHPVLSDSVL